MNDKALHVIKTLTSASHRAVVAGGAVRALIMKEKPHDWDIATSATPEQIKALFPKVLNVGVQFGVSVVIIDGTPIEVATFRKDGKYSDGRRPDTVELTNILEEDAARRDFTMNAMFYEPMEDVIIDFFGGEKDIENKVIRAVGDPNNRIREDRLRMLRAIRFHAMYKFRLDNALRSAIYNYNYSLPTTVSLERIRDEIIKICAAAYPASGFQLMQEVGILRYVLPEVFYTVDCKQDPVHHPEGDVWTHTMGVVTTLKELGADPLLIFAGLLHDIGKVSCSQIYEDENGVERISNKDHDTVGAEAALRRCEILKFPRAFSSKICKLIKEHIKAHTGHKMKRSTLVSFMRDLEEKDVLGRQILLQHADGVNSGSVDKSLLGFYTENLSILSNNVKAKCLINGDDLISVFNLSSGPIFKVILEGVQELQDEGKLTNKQEALAYVEEKFIRNKNYAKTN